MRTLGLIFLMMLPATEAWRAEYEAKLRGPQGWLSLAGLVWLQNGLNTVALPARCGAAGLAVEFHAGRAVLLGKEMIPDRSLTQDCGVTATLIQRGSRFGIRLRDPEADTRRSFKGLRWFPVDDRFRVQARWHAYQPAKAIPITNVLGDTQDDACPGYAEFDLNGVSYKLEPVVEDGELFFMFRDLTSSDLTYGSGRFLKAAMPTVDNTVVLDFNRAYNPPCAYTEFATCPLPPKQNRLAVRISAGEQRYGAH